MCNFAENGLEWIKRLDDVMITYASIYILIMNHSLLLLPLKMILSGRLFSISNLCMYGMQSTLFEKPFYSWKLSRWFLWILLSYQLSWPVSDKHSCWLIDRWQDHPPWLLELQHESDWERTLWSSELKVLVHLTFDRAQHLLGIFGQGIFKPTYLPKLIISTMPESFQQSTLQLHIPEPRTRDQSLCWLINLTMLLSLAGTLETHRQMTLE